MNQSISKSIIFALGLLALISTHNAVAEVAIIVHPSNESTIDIGIIKKLFLGKKKSFSNGTSVHLFIQKGDMGEEFTKKFLSRSPSQFKAYWAKRTFSGKGKPPKSLSNSIAIKEMVAATPNAIGFIDANEVDASIKVVVSQ